MCISLSSVLITHYRMYSARPGPGKLYKSIFSRVVLIPYNCFIVQVPIGKSSGLGGQKHSVLLLKEYSLKKNKCLNANKILIK